VIFRSATPLDADIAARGPDLLLTDQEGKQSLQGVQVGAGGAPAGGKREVAIEVSQGQLAGGNQLTGFALPAGSWEGALVWRLEGDEGWRRPLHGGHCSRSH
jgi:hypothetical protein